MEARFDVDDIRRLKYRGDKHCDRMDLNVDDGWLHIGVSTSDDWNRMIEYSYTFPLEEWILDEVKKIVIDAQIPFWDTGECQYHSRVDYDESWNLQISTIETEFVYWGYDAFPRGYDRLSKESTALAISMSDMATIDLKKLKNVYLSTDTRLNNDCFNLSDRTLYATVNGKSEILDTVPEHFEAIKFILNDYKLHAYAPKECRPIEYGKSITLSLTDKYENRLKLWWGEDRPAWVDGMVNRLYDAMKDAYRDERTVMKSTDPFLPRNPDEYYLSDETKKEIMSSLRHIGENLPIDERSLLETWDCIIERREHLLRRLSIGKPVNMEEFDRLTRAAEEMEQFRRGRLDFEKINELLNFNPESRVHPYIWLSDCSVYISSECP